MANDLRVYGLVVALKDRLEINAEREISYSKSQLVDAVSLINQLNEVLDRRQSKKSR